MAEEKVYMQIGEVSERTGVTQRTLRFYEEKGLLKPPSRMEGGFRLYTEEDIQRVKQIRQLQKLLGFSLAEIKEMLEAGEAISLLKAEYRAEADLGQRKEKLERAIEINQSQIKLMDQKIEQLTQLRSYWQQKLAPYEKLFQELEKEEQARLAVQQA
jgi:DNA-binding transcriptional MerR regulator